MWGTFSLDAISYWWLFSLCHNRAALDKDLLLFIRIPYPWATGGSESTNPYPRQPCWWQLQAAFKQVPLAQSPSLFPTARQGRLCWRKLLGFQTVESPLTYKKLFAQAVNKVSTAVFLKSMPRIISYNGIFQMTEPCLLGSKTRLTYFNLMAAFWHNGKRMHKVGNLLQIQRKIGNNTFSWF